jgi:hypothetical protein
VASIDELKSGFDRRAALKKAAAAGAITWVAPSIVSDKALAVDSLPGGCTAKCAPSDSVSVTGVVRLLECVEGGPAGLQGVAAEILSLVFSGESCGCGGTPIIVDAQKTRIEVGDIIVLGARPGNNPLTLEVSVSVVCTDRAGNEVSRPCSGTLATESVSGNCNSLGDIELTYQVVLSCGNAVCEN